MTSTQQSALDELDPVAKAVFTEDVLTAMGFKNLSDAERQELYDTMIVTIQDRVLASVLDQLSTAERTELTRLLEHSNPDEVSAYVADHVPDLNGLMASEALKYKGEMIANALHIQKILGIHPTPAA